MFSLLVMLVWQIFLDKGFISVINKDFPLGEGNLIFCCMSSRGNYFGLLSWENNNNNPSFRVSTSKNKNTDYGV